MPTPTLEDINKAGVKLFKSRGNVYYNEPGVSGRLSAGLGQIKDPSSLGIDVNALQDIPDSEFNVNTLASKYGVQGVNTSKQNFNTGSDFLNYFSQNYNTLPDTPLPAPKPASTLPPTDFQKEFASVKASGGDTDQFLKDYAARQQAANPQNYVIPPPTQPTETGTTDASALGRKLGPTEFNNLRKELGASEANFDQYFARDAQGNIYLKNNAAPGPVKQNPDLPAGLGRDQNGQIVKLDGASGLEKQPGESYESYASRLGSSIPSKDGAPAGSGGTVGTSDKSRAAAIAAIKNELAPNALPEAVNSAAERIKLRQEQGIVNDEADLNDIRTEAALAKEELRQFRATAGQGVTEGGRLGAVSEAERNLNYRLEGLAIRESSLVDRLNSKNAYINQVISDKREDYNSAVGKWNAEYKINSDAIDALNSQLDDQKKDALTTVTTLQNLLSDSGLTYDQFPADLKTQLESSALKAGLPKDVFAAVYAGVDAGDKVISHFLQDNKAGGKDVYTLVQGKDGSVSLNKVSTITDVKSTGSGGGTTNKQLTGDVQTDLNNYALRKSAGEDVPSWVDQYLVVTKRNEDTGEPEKYEAVKITKGDVEDIQSSEAEYNTKQASVQEEQNSDPNYIAKQIMEDRAKGVGYEDIRAGIATLGVSPDVYRQALRIVLEQGG
jgi:hypothetical protein